MASSSTADALPAGGSSEQRRASLASVKPPASNASVVSNASSIRALLAMGGLRRRIQLHSQEGDEDLLAAAAAAAVERWVGDEPPPKPSGSLWKKLHSHSRARTLVSGLLSGQRKSTFLRNMEEQQRAASVVYERRRSEVVPIWQQGDMELYSEENIDRRQGLRQDPLVVAQLRNWWQVALRMMRSLGKGDADHLGEQEYVVLFRKVYKAIVLEYDAEEALTCVRDDWVHDSAGSGAMSQEGYMDCLFELADVWTLSVEAEEYATFLQRLLGTIAKGEPPDLIDDDLIEAGGAQPTLDDDDDDDDDESEAEAAAKFRRPGVEAPEDPAKQPALSKPRPWNYSSLNVKRRFSMRRQSEMAPLPITKRALEAKKAAQTVQNAVRRRSWQRHDTQTKKAWLEALQPLPKSQHERARLGGCCTRASSSVLFGSSWSLPHPDTAVNMPGLPTPKPLTPAFKKLASFRAPSGRALTAANSAAMVVASMGGTEPSKPQPPQPPQPEAPAPQPEAPAPQPQPQACSAPAISREASWAVAHAVLQLMHAPGAAPGAAPAAPAAPAAMSPRPPPARRAMSARSASSRTAVALAAAAPAEAPPPPRPATARAAPSRPSARSPPPPPPPPPSRSATATPTPGVEAMRAPGCMPRLQTASMPPGHMPWLAIAPADRPVSALSPREHSAGRNGWMPSQPQPQRPASARPRPPSGSVATVASPRAERVPLHAQQTATAQRISLEDVRAARRDEGGTCVVGGGDPTPRSAAAVLNVVAGRTPRRSKADVQLLRSMQTRRLAGGAPRPQQEVIPLPAGSWYTMPAGMPANGTSTTRKQTKVLWSHSPRDVGWEAAFLGSYQLPVNT